MRILTFDCSVKSTGWASLFDSGNGMNVASGSHSVEIPKGLKKTTVPGARFVWYVRWLDEMFSDYRPQVVICEQPHFRGGRGTEALVGLCTRVEEYCSRYNAAYQQLHSATLKKFATGSGRADKEDMKSAAEKRWSFYDRTEDPGGDEADALMMLAWGIENIKGL